MAPITPHWTQPSHPELIQVHYERPSPCSKALATPSHDDPSLYTSSAKSLVSLPRGALLTRMTSTTPAPHATYATVQTSATTHINLNSDLLYCNHSCAPSLEFDVAPDRMEVRVSRYRDLQVGDDLTFFYPSTEWSMARGFECRCGAGEACLGWVGGMRDLLERRGVEGLRSGGWWVNEFMGEMVGEWEREREGKAKGVNGVEERAGRKEEVKVGNGWASNGVNGRS